MSQMVHLSYQSKTSLPTTQSVKVVAVSRDKDNNNKQGKKMTDQETEFMESILFDDEQTELSEEFIEDLEKIDTNSLKKFEDRFGSVECFGRKIVIMQLPYIDHNHYQAVGEDEEGIEYLIKWRIINRYADDDIDACDWTKFTVKKL